MINKNFDLLGEQLAESGLEMNIVIAPVVAASLISGGASILGGIFGSNAEKDSTKNRCSTANQ